ncbi:hypothetical protein N6H05_26050 (plasmid) [Sphingobium sp. WTD-1]|uniref:hypothetical protein n=1 Tax=Sphingobium sp. WTD-1 TaxID=2979467 RepID=UPI0024DEB45C|nr:hypothetical protein [Sphingobium sp. WTD-1]WIA59174.1 hypothetical protein N6H05_26050 [Sphingobium sp. WTD-1]
MRYPGTVIFAPEKWFIVVSHDEGFTLIEMDEDETGIVTGDVLYAKSWLGDGSKSLSCGNVIHRGQFWGSYDTRTAAMRKALQFVTKQD